MILSHLPGRDDVADIMLGNELSKLGCMVWKYPALGQQRLAICLIKPDIIILPEIRLEFMRDLAKQCKEWGIRVVQKRCEMGATEETFKAQSTDELERCLFGNLAYQDYIDLDLVWGPKFASMVEAHGTPKEKIRVVGALGFDPYFLDKPQVVPYKKNRVLFAGGFGYADKNAMYAIPEAKPGEKIHIDLVKADRENRAEFMQLIEAFIQRYPDWEVFVRPHPGELYMAYQKVFGDKIKPACEMPALVAIQMVDITIHPGSTLALECHLVNKPSLNFRNTNLDVLVGAIAPRHDNIESLLEAVHYTELGTSNARAEALNKLDEYYGPIDGKANRRAAEEIVKLPISTTNIPNEWPEDTVRYLTKGVYTGLEYWRCATCGHECFSDPGRDTAKCPFCGIVMNKRPLP